MVDMSRVAEGEIQNATVIGLVIQEWTSTKIFYLNGEAGTF